MSMFNLLRFYQFERQNLRQVPLDVGGEVELEHLLENRLQLRIAGPDGGLKPKVFGNILNLNELQMTEAVKRTCRQ